ncbi:unnamed protein product [Merluccius merluccius]
MSTGAPRERFGIHFSQMDRFPAALRCSSRRRCAACAPVSRSLPAEGKEAGGGGGGGDDGLQFLTKFPLKKEASVAPEPRGLAPPPPPHNEEAVGERVARASR